jgi:WD40 repeat protein
MQEIDIESNLEYINNLKIEDMMPKNILYPDQDSNLIFGNYSLNTTKKKFELNKRTLKKVPFSTDNESIVYDVFLEGELLIACGGNFVRIYRTNNLLDAIFTFFCSGEDFYRVAYSEIPTDNGLLMNILAVGGKKAIIKILDLNERKEIAELIGHRNEIYDLKFSPRDKHLLLSASHDFSVRLWNVMTNIQICIFGGPYGHSAEVISIDWHPSCNYFVSSGVDYYVKIWSFNNKITSAIQKSNKVSNEKFKTVIKCTPIFSCNKVHDNYVDCVRFNGNFVLSKSVDGVIREWLPFFSKDKESDTYQLINTYVYKVSEPLWYIKFGLEAYTTNLLAVGNSQGSLFFFTLNEESEEEVGLDVNYFYTQKHKDLIQISDQIVIRSVCIDPLSQSLAFGGNSGSLYIIQLN